MAHAEIKETLGVSKDKLWDAITRYEDYPKFVDGCTAVKVERKSAGHARVTYSVSMVKDITYVMDHKEDKEKGIVSWSLVESDFFKKNDGHWNIKDSGADKTAVDYQVEVEFKIPVPGFMLKGLINKNLPSMIKSFEKQAKAGADRKV
jgi:ribosome-associated toxin RatA of RatAB toxin-antitoxin module